jgi:hypothetical protein
MLVIMMTVFCIIDVIWNLNEDTLILESIIIRYLGVLIGLALEFISMQLYCVIVSSTFHIL